MYRKITKAQTKEIITKYSNGTSYCSIAREYSVNEETVRKLLIREGVYVGRGVRRYSINESFFEKIDTEAKAYWLGFISADGHVGDYELRIQLGAKDKDHLRKFKESIKAEHPISELSGQCGTPVVRICVGSKKLSKSLRRLGLDSNKTFNIKPCDRVPENLLRHYWRGVVDGDGWILKRKTGWDLGLCSASHEFLEGFREFIINHIPNYSGKVKQDKKTLYRLRCNGISMPRQMASILYYNSSVYLDRKKVMAEQAVSSIEKIRDLSYLDADTLEFLYARENKNWASVARFLGISPSNFTTFRGRTFSLTL
jgi:hypothetical protein